MLRKPRKGKWMRLWSRFKSTFRNLFRQPSVKNQLDDELRAYVDMIADERMAAGMSASEARRTARAESGGIEQVKQAVRDHRAGAGLELFWRDVRFGLSACASCGTTLASPLLHCRACSWHRSQYSHLLCSEYGSAQAAHLSQRRSHGRFSGARVRIQW